MRETTNPYSIAEHLSVARGASQSVSRGRVWLLVALLGGAGLTARVLLGARAAVQAGEAALARGDQSAAVRDFQHAVRLYLPASPFVAQAVAQLRGLAEAAAAAGDGPGEQRALLGLRAGLLGARSLYTPFAADLAFCNQRLAAIYGQAELPGQALSDTGEQSVAARTSWHQQRLSRRPGPAPATTIALLGGFALWLGAAVSFTRRGIDRTLALRRCWAVGCALGFAAGLVLFVSSYWLA